MWVAGASVLALVDGMCATLKHSPAAGAGHSDPGVGVDGEVWSGGWVRVAVALVVAGQTMSFSLATNLSPPDGAAYVWLHAGLLVSALLVLALLGGPLVRECWASLRRRRVTVDLLFFVTLTGALAVSIYGSVQRLPCVYYELVAVLLAIYTVGKMLGARSRARALKAVEQMRQEHGVCRVVEASGREIRRSAGEVVAGMRVRVSPGEAVPVDGCIVEGRGWLETTPLTGELEPRVFGPGDEIWAGMRSLDGVLLIEVHAAAGARRLDRLLEGVAGAQVKPSRIQSKADRLAARFVPLVVLIGVSTFVGWYLASGLQAAVINSLAVAVVACPCALGLATPLGLWSGLVRLGRLGIVAGSGDFLENLATATTVIFDKTGTLFEPELGVRRLAMETGSPVEERELRGLLGAAEAGIDHPVAAALRRLGPDGVGEEWRQREVRVIPACGLEATVVNVRSGRVHGVWAGELAWIATRGGAAQGGAWEGDGGGRRIAVAIDRRLVAVVELEETPRVQTGRTFERMEELGLRLAILTGDRAFSDHVWPQVARKAGLTPEEKVSEVRRRQREGERVVFVGDGQNDAAALAVANASVALSHGAELARSSSMAVMSGESLDSLPEAIEVAREVNRAIRSNLWLAATYNLVGIAVAAAGWLHPVGAALLMAGSSIVVSARVVRGRVSQKVSRRD